MIYNIRGTSGAGKTHLARLVLTNSHRYASVTPIMVEGRRRPLAYQLRRKAEPFNAMHPEILIVLGSYENTCGGCDTIKRVEDVFNMAREYADSIGFDVFMEGLLLSEDKKRTLAAHEAGTPLSIFYLDTTLEDCLASINGRREARGVTEPVNPDNTRRRLHMFVRDRQRLKAEGLNVEWGDRTAGTAWLNKMGLI